MPLRVGFVLTRVDCCSFPPAQAFFFDGRNIMDHAALRKIGFEVHAIGKGKLIRETAAASK